jgi:small subunit ribosomal protein S5
MSEREKNQSTIEKEGWNPKTEIGKKVKSGEITNIDEIIDNGFKILEPEIVEILLPDLKTELLLIGQSKGKFGGGQRRVFRQTQKKTSEGNKPQFAAFAVVGDENGHVGIGYGKSRETVPAREKAMRNAKLNIIKIRRGCGSWQCSCGEPHTIPFTVESKCGSSIMKIMPAPKGKGLCIEKECQKILNLAGISDVWSKTKGQTKVKTNLIIACFDALNKLSTTRLHERHYKNLGIIEGSIKKKEEIKEEEPEKEDEMINIIKKKVEKQEAPKKENQSEEKGSKEETKENEEVKEKNKENGPGKE